jgi:alpha-ketoglutarate-dependent taurine dioxygenase
MTDNVIRLNANIKAPDFTLIKPPKNPEDYQLDCREFQNHSALEDAIRERFYQKGVVLLMNTSLKNVEELKQWAKILTSDFMPYEGGDSPRNKIVDHVYDVKGEVSFIYVHHHNEMSYLPRFPQCVLFGCLAIPNQGGETLIADDVAVTYEILQTELGQKLKEKGICHIRNYTNANNTSTSIVHKHWQNTFYVDSKEQMENFAQREGWTFKWMEQDNLQISYKTDAYEYNEAIGENILFTSLGHHGAYFDEAILAIVLN